MATYTSKYAIGQFVYLRTDEEQAQRQIVEVKFMADGSTAYHLACGVNYSMHYEIEISPEVNMALKLNIDK